MLPENVEWTPQNSGGPEYLPPTLRRNRAVLLGSWVVMNLGAVLRGGPSFRSALLNTCHLQGEKTAPSWLQTGRRSHFLPRVPENRFRRNSGHLHRKLNLERTSPA